MMPNVVILFYIPLSTWYIARRSSHHRSISVITRLSRRHGVFTAQWQTLDAVQRRLRLRFDLHTSGNGV
jgi:hypothetical protein